MARKGRRQLKKQLLNTTKGTIQEQEPEQTEEIVNIVNNVDEHGFYSDGTYAKTGEIYDERGFKIDGTNIYTHGKFDKRGFDIKGYFNGINGVKYDYAGFDKDGYNSKGFDSNGRHKDTNRFYGPDGLNIHGRTREQQAFWEKAQQAQELDKKIAISNAKIDELEATIARLQAELQEEMGRRKNLEEDRSKL